MTTLGYPLADHPMVRLPAAWSRWWIVTLRQGARLLEREVFAPTPLAAAEAVRISGWTHASVRKAQ